MKIIYTTLIFSVLLSFNANAQFGGLMNKAKDKAEQKAKEKAEKEKKEAEEKAKRDAEQSAKNGGNANSGNNSVTYSNTSTPKTATNSPYKTPVPDVPVFVKDHYGQVVFFPGETDFEYPKLTPKTDFTYDENLQMRIYLEKSVEEYPVYKEGNPTNEAVVNNNGDWHKGEYQLRILTDDGQIVKVDHIEVRNSEIFLIFMEHNSSGTTTTRVPKWESAYRKLAVGKHNIKVEFWGYTKTGLSTPKPLATGEFTITKKEGEELNYRMREFNKETITDNGITSVTHKNNLGKIVFSKVRIPEKNEVASTFQNDFTGSDVIYARCYMPHSLWNIPIIEDSTTEIGERNRGSKFSVQLIIDGIPADSIKEFDGYALKYLISMEYRKYKNMDYKEDDNVKKLTTLEFAINLSRAEINSMEDTDEGYDAPGLKGTDWPLIANKLSIGEHIIKVVVWPGGGTSTRNYQPVCSSEFKYIKKAGDHVRIGPDFAKLNKPKLKDPALEAAIMKGCKSYDETWANPVKVVILNDSWTVETNSFTGKPARRYQIASIVFKQKDGSCIIKTAVVMQQDYIVGTGYGGLYVKQSQGRSFQIECDLK